MERCNIAMDDAVGAIHIYIYACMCMNVHLNYVHQVDTEPDTVSQYTEHAHIYIVQCACGHEYRSDAATRTLVVGARNRRPKVTLQDLPHRLEAV